METATILSIFISSLLLGITAYSIYTAFGPTAKDLRDPFEEHEGAARYSYQEKLQHCLI
uniref:Protein PsbN n=1 Tax=Bangiopsis subsimplex TaxID=139980 RepID=A0A1C9CCQ7_9RHOD|nr:photosystem II protein N [Bangiopsis subsimplex]AOM66155.1 photosystem II protein N [Bangiopsis subsimplex]ARO90485.1 photosystem II reaction center protein N [Bangiopsis subsimplex]